MTHTIISGNTFTTETNNTTHPTFQKIEVPQSFQFIQEKSDAYTITLDETFKGKLLYLSFEIESKEENK